MTGARPELGRIEDARVTHLEIWDAVVNGASLFAQRDDEAYPAHVAEVAGREAEARGVTTVYLGGGDPRLVVVARELRRLGLDARVAPDPVFVAAPGALARIGASRAPLLVDAGQTSFKVVTASRRVRVAREPSWQGERGFLAALGRVVAEAEAHDAAVVGLPCQIEDSAGLASSYFGRLDLREVAALFRVPVWIASDAELAAHSFLALHPREAALVLTLGHGVGGAVVQP